MSEETIIPERQPIIADWLEEADGLNNYGILSGKLQGEFQYSHSFRGQKYYKAKIEIKRRSGTCDVIPVSISESVFNDWKEKELKGKHIEVTGKICTHDVWENFGENERVHHLVTFFSADSIAESSEEKEINNVVCLQGYICKIFLKTKVSGTRIAEIFVAVERNNGEKDYIPCVSWNYIASWIETQYRVGDKIELQGRLQSRKYFKKNPHNPEYGEMRTTYEIAIAKIF